ARAAAGALAARRDPQPPQQPPPLAPLVAGARGDERLECVLAGGRTACEVADVDVRLLGGDRVRLVLADGADVAEPDPHRAALDRAGRGADVDVRRVDVHPAPLRVAHE